MVSATVGQFWQADMGQFHQAPKATKLAEAGTPESTMLAIMGHMSPAMLERYSYIRMKAKREAVKSLELPKVGPRLISSTSMSSRRQSQCISDPAASVSV